MGYVEGHDDMADPAPILGTCPRCKQQMVPLVVMDNRCLCDGCWNWYIAKDAPDPKEARP